MTKKYPTTHKGWWKKLQELKTMDGEERVALSTAYGEWIKENLCKYTIEVSLLNEQTGNKEWGGKTITFYNEDNAISHLGLLEKFFELLLENKDWGFNHTPDEVVENILNPLKERIQPPSKEKVKE